MLTARRSLLAVLGVGCLLGGGAAFAAAQQIDSSSSGAASMDLATTAVAQVQTTLIDSFAVFRDRPAAAMPADVAAMVGSPSRFGRNPALARAITTPTGPGWVIPGDGYLCVAMPDPVDGYGTSCVPSDIAAQQGLSLALHGNLPGGQAAEVLVVPDGAEAVVTDEAGNETAVPGDAGVASAWTPRPGSLHLKR